MTVKIFSENVKLHRMSLRTKPIEYEENNGCWIVVNRTLDKDGYAKVMRNKKYYRVHRYIFELLNGEIPKNMVIMHKCDNPTCINPDHLSLGTNKENMSDRNKKKRQAFGEKNGSCILTEKQVLEIAKRLENNERSIDIANDLNVHKTTISNIKRRKNWSYLTKNFKF